MKMAKTGLANDICNIFETHIRFKAKLTKDAITDTIHKLRLPVILDTFFL
jgi:hypothetical protein